MTARLVAVGRVTAPYRTLRVQYAITDPLWSARESGEIPEVDPSDFRKQRIEGELCRDDL